MVLGHAVTADDKLALPPIHIAPAQAHRFRTPRPAVRQQPKKIGEDLTASGTITNGHLGQSFDRSSREEWATTRHVPQRLNPHNRIVIDETLVTSTAEEVSDHRQCEIHRSGRPALPQSVVSEAKDPRLGDLKQSQRSESALGQPTQVDRFRFRGAQPLGELGSCKVSGEETVESGGFWNRSRNRSRSRSGP